MLLSLRESKANRCAFNWKCQADEIRPIGEEHLLSSRHRCRPLFHFKLISIPNRFLILVNGPSKSLFLALFPRSNSHRTVVYRYPHVDGISPSIYSSVSLLVLFFSTTITRHGVFYCLLPMEIKKREREKEKKICSNGVIPTGRQTLWACVLMVSFFYSGGTTTKNIVFSLSLSLGMLGRESGKPRADIYILRLWKILSTKPRRQQRRSFFFLLSEFEWTTQS